MDDNNNMSIFDSDDIELNIGNSLPEDFFTDVEVEVDEDDNTQDVDDKVDSSEEKIKEYLNDDQDDEAADDDESDDEGQEDVVKKDAQGEEGDDDQDGDSPNVYSSFANVLNEQGLLPSLDSNKKIETIDDLADVLREEQKIQAKDYLIEKIGEDGYDALEKGITLAEYQQYQDGVQTLNGIDPDSLAENIELSKNIILQDYIAQGLSEDKAYRLLEKTVELGDEAIVEDAKYSLQSLKEIQDLKLEQAKEQRNAEILAEQKKQEKIDNDLKNSIYNSNEIIQGLNMTKAMKEKVYKSITSIVSKSPDGVAENKLMRHRREDPVEFDKKLYYLYELTNQFTDFSALISKSKSKATKDFEKVLRANKSQINNDQPGFVNDPESYGGIGDELIF